MNKQIQRTTKKLSWFAFFLLSFAVAGASKLPFSSGDDSGGNLNRLGATAAALFGAQSAHADFTAGASEEGPVLGQGCSGCGGSACDSGSSGYGGKGESESSSGGSSGSSGGGCGGCGGPAAHREFLS